MNYFRDVELVSWFDSDITSVIKKYEEKNIFVTVEEIISFARNFSEEEFQGVIHVDSIDMFIEYDFVEKPKAIMLEDRDINIQKNSEEEMKINIKLLDVEYFFLRHTLGICFIPKKIYALFEKSFLNKTEDVEEEEPENNEKSIDGVLEDIGARLEKLENFISILLDQDSLKQPTIKSVDTTDNLTVVTGLWNIDRVGRDFDNHYIENFKKFLEFPVNMHIYIPEELEELVWTIRDRSNTEVKIMELKDIRENYYSSFWEKTQQIRTNESWLSQSSWIPESPQAKNEWYNAIVQSKMFMLHDAKIINKFDTDYFVWLDAGITNTVYENFFTNDRCFDKIIPYLEKFLFLSYPYESETEIHGFEVDKINSYARQKVTYVCRGGLFGGHKDYLTIANDTYYHLLLDTLHSGYMGTEESLFSIMAHREPHVYRRYELDDNGLIVKFIQALLDDSVELSEVPIKDHEVPKISYSVNENNTSLYVLSFNFPDQFMQLCNSFKENDVDWLEKPSRKILVNNSVDKKIIKKYQKICDEWGFEHIITGENLGICGGRQLVAEHFDGSDSDYYMFFEDDMTLHRPITEDDQYNNIFCRNGFKRYIPDLYSKLHHIMAREEFDFLKLNFTEVYMDNNIQVSWYNVPQEIRSELWPDYDVLPVSGLDPFAPRTKFNRIDSYAGLSYVTGDIYYANWPMIVNKEGNRKMFLDQKWEHPYEQTWMSYIFQETLKGNIKPAVLLASPIEHDRTNHYTPEERREN